MRNNSRPLDPIGYVTDHLRVARFVADQQGLDFLVYLIEMAMIEGKSHVSQAPVTETQQGTTVTAQVGADGS